jgi:hypothetical protein
LINHRFEKIAHGCGGAGNHQAAETRQNQSPRVFLDECKDAAMAIFECESGKQCHAISFLIYTTLLQAVRRNALYLSHGGAFVNKHIGSLSNWFKAIAPISFLLIDVSCSIIQ